MMKLCLSMLITLGMNSFNFFFKFETGKKKKKHSGLVNSSVYISVSL